MFLRIRFDWRIWLWACLISLAPAAARAQSREYEIKAAFLVNFMQFVTWPPAAFAGEEAPFCIALLGEDPFGPALDQVVQGETVNHRKVVIQRARRIEQCKDCQMVFISRSEEKNLPAILAALDASPVLSVSEIRGFARRGGIINLYLEGNKVRFEINLVAARQSGLKISSQLLALGKIVETAKTLR